MRRCTLFAWFAVLAFFYVVSAVPRAQVATSFEPLGLGPAGIGSVQSDAWDASADGSVVIGEFWESKNGFFLRHGFRWEAATGMRDLGSLDPNAIEVQPLAVSGDGSKIVGWARGTSGFQRPFVWIAAGGMRELVEVPGTDAVASDISRDGRVIVGYFLNGSYQAFQWRDGVVTALGFLANEPNSFARAVCGLGDVVVGSTQSAGGLAFRWTPTGGMKDLGALRTGAPSYAQDCSDDGKIAVGVSGDGKGLPPVRWAPDGVRSLGTLGGDSGEAHATSADGAVVVGAAGLPFVNGISEFSAFRWTPSQKIQQLSRVLEQRGVSTPFCHDPSRCAAGIWFLQLALGISPDGNVIVGSGQNPDGFTEAYRAVVP